MYEARKGAGSVNSGIKKLQEFDTIYISEKCPNTCNEFEVLEHPKNERTSEIDEDNYNIDPHCLTGDTLVWTENGKIEIKDLKNDTPVYSYNEKTHNLELKKCFDVRKTRKNAEVYEFKMKNGKKIRCTADHLILTKNGWIEAKNITQNDLILDINLKY